MGGLILLVAFCALMMLASFLAGALPLSMTLTQSRMRLISSIGIGVLVGTSLIVIIPEGIQAAAASPAEIPHIHRTRSLLRRSPWTLGIQDRDIIDLFSPTEDVQNRRLGMTLPHTEVRQSHASTRRQQRQKTEDGEDDGERGETPAKAPPSTGQEQNNGASHEPHGVVPTFEIGFSMILGFILMFLIDRLPRHATESLRSAPEPRHMSLDNLVGGATSADEEADGFLGSLAPSPRTARSLATTVGLVIHAAADGIAMGASATSSNMRLGLVIFLAIMLHKAPAAFGLTSVLLRQGLSRRAARGHLIIFSLAAPLGALTTWFLVALLGGEHAGGQSQWWTGMLLLFSGGTFLYVAMHAMQEDSAPVAHDHGMSINGFSEGNSAQQRRSKGPQMRNTLATVAGMLLPLLTQIGHSH